MSEFARFDDGSDTPSSEVNSLLAAIVESAGDAIISVDLNGTILSWNHAATRLYSYSAREMIGQPMSRIIPRNRHAQLDALLFRIDNGERYHGLETVHRTATGREVAVTMAASPVRDCRGRVVAMAAFIHAQSHGRTLRTPARPLPADSMPPAAARTILIVEEEILTGLSLALMLENAGFDVIGPVASIASAMTMLDNHSCALAIIDAHLTRGETSAPLAQRLEREGIPFLALNGNGAETRPALFHGGRNFPKPFRARALVAAVHDVLG